MSLWLVVFVAVASYFVAMACFVAAMACFLSIWLVSFLSLWLVPFVFLACFFGHVSLVPQI